MLILSRKRGESILMPELGVRITVVGIVGGQVRIGVNADKSIRIYREEIYDGASSGRSGTSEESGADVH